MAFAVISTNVKVFADDTSLFSIVNDASETFYNHCVKSVRIRSFSGPYFSAFRLNTEICRANLCSQFKCGEIGTRKTSNTDTINAVNVSNDLRISSKWAYRRKISFNQDISKVDREFNFSRETTIVNFWEQTLNQNFPL